MNLEKQITEKLLTKLDQATVIDYVANNYSCVECGCHYTEGCPCNKEEEDN